jgi:misacylated tRNA(Ala) deacylase
MVDLVYQRDSYIRELDARITGIDGNSIYLDRTIFHPRSGGVENDTGLIVKGSAKARVVKVVFDKSRNDAAHIVDDPSPLKPGDTVHLVIDWERRYCLMRLHTAAHILAAVMYSKHGALITGGNISPGQAYDDYSLETLDKNIFLEAIEEANSIVRRGIPVKIYWLSREEALKIPGIVKLASRLPPEVEKLRIVEIPGVDIQADGGPHVRNTSEIGEIKLVKIANKGRKRKRLYYTVEPCSLNG